MSNDTQPSKGRIVVGVDGSEASVDALRWAARQAMLTRADLEAVVAWHFPVLSGDSPLSTVLDWHADALIAVDSLIKKSRLPESLSISCEVIEGHPSKVLIEAAAGADLLVVGSRGRGGFSEMLLGSVSEQVCAHAPCPVLVIRHTTPA